MKRKLSVRETIAVASLLFGLFFGAGNLIFPVHMGQMAGSSSLRTMVSMVFPSIKAVLQ